MGFYICKFGNYNGEFLGFSPGYPTRSQNLCLCLLKVYPNLLATYIKYGPFSLCMVPILDDLLFWLQYLNSWDNITFEIF